MGIEWFRDLSIIILALITVAMLIFMSVLVYRLYRILKPTLSYARATSEIAYETVKQLRAVLKPIISIAVFIQGIRQGFSQFNKMFNKEEEKGGDKGE